MTSQELATNVQPVKVAIAASGLTQRRIAKRARIEETRFSRIVRGHVSPLPRERKAIARVIGQPVESLFPEPAESAVPA